jgi:3' exoribonuclease, RNase T-like
MRHIMLDLETLGQDTGCAIMSIGACMFTPQGVSQCDFYKTISLDFLKGTIDPTTLKWWWQQKQETRDEFLSSKAQSHTDVLLAFVEWVRNVSHIDRDLRIWSHGATFDVEIIEAALKAENISIPWTYRDARDTRTVYEMANVKVVEPKIKHHALYDAIAQAEAVIKSWQILNVWQEDTK